MNPDFDGLDCLFYARPVPTILSSVVAHCVKDSTNNPSGDYRAATVDFLIEQRSFPEAFPTKIARNARLGRVSPRLEFVATDWTQAVDNGFELSDIAIGPGFGMDGFEAISDLVLPAKVDILLDAFDGCTGTVTVIIARVDYLVNLDAWDTLRVKAAPLYLGRGNKLKLKMASKIKHTADWLAQDFAARLRMEKYLAMKKFGK